MKVKYVSWVMAMLSVCAAHGAGVDINSPKTITADKIEYDLKSETIKTTGNTEIVNQTGQRMTLKDSYLSKTGDDLAGDDIKLWLGSHVYLESDNIVRNGDDTIAHRARFTACDGCDEMGDAWSFFARRIRHSMDDRMMYFYNAVFYTYDLPVFWFPYFSMPDPSVKHKTGLLIPSMESTNKMGTQINIPVYLYLSDTHDMTVTLSYLTNENPLFQAEHRLNLPHSEFRSRGSFTRNRDGDSRWHIINNDVIEMGEHVRTKVFLERASDKTYLQKYGFYDDQPYLDSGAALELFGQSGYVVADAHIFQELRQSTGVYTAPNGNILPNVRGVYQTAPLFGETFMTLNTDLLGIAGSGVSSQRLIGDVRITSPWTLPFGNRITASLDARYDVYNFSDVEMIDGSKFSGVKNRFLPSGYVEWGLPLVRPSSGWSQVIEPRARLTIMRHTDQEQFSANNDSVGALMSDTTLFSDNRFAGLDLWENGTFADYGLRWAAFKNSGDTIEAFFGQSYDFTDRMNTDPNSGFHNGTSDFVGRVGYNNMKWLEMYSRFRMAREDMALRHIETSVRVGTAGNYINVGHIWSRQFDATQTTSDTINELMGGAGVQLTNRLSFRFNAVYNMTYERFQRHSGALYYEHPCYYLSVGYRRDNTVKEDYVGNTTFQFRFGMSVDGKHY